ncbi:MAG: glycerol-3-phosphate acyltransferase [Chloroflexi bacterium]|nr:glycerol-3-phosphate acyltransferase [Chloroflexota bacterium]
MSFQEVLTIAITSYLIGSFPTAYVIGRLHGINIFEIGSGNMGANNTARALGIQWGILVWLLDGFKGIAALLLAREIAAHHTHDYSSAAMIIGAISVVVGHNWSIFASLITGRIRGGKGAATATGTWVLLVPPLIIAICLMLWATIVFVTRYVSLGVLASVAFVSAVMVGMVILKEADPVYVGYILVTAMIFYRHRENIKALLKGKERRWGERAS